jgi:TonB-linked SusC/RagA family outer membrane protein
MDGTPVAHWSNAPNLVGTTIPFSPQPDNFKDVFSNSFTMSNNLLATVGSKNSQTAFAYTRENASGVLESNKLGRHDLTLRITNQLTKWLSLDTKLNYIQQSLDNPNSTGDDAFFNPFRNIYRMPRNIRVSDLQQFEYTDATGNNRQNFWNPGSTSGKNPYWIMNRILTLQERKRIVGLASLNINLTKDLDVIVRTSYDGSNFNQEQKVYKDTYGATYDFGFYGVQKNNNVQWNSDALVTYKKQLNKDFNVNALVGGTIRTTGGEGALTANTTQQLIVPNFFGLGNTQIPAASFTPSNETQTQSVYFSGNFGFKNAVYLDVTGRNDWSSTLPADSRSYFYPSVGVSTVLTDLIPTLPKVISYAKLRASWAMVGNSAPPYALSRAAVLAAGGNNGFVTLGGILPNADLKPERTESTEIGLDVRFFEGRLGFDLTAYKSNTYDQLFTIALPIGSGAAAFFTNGGDVENKGIEAIIRGTPIQKSSFIWDVTANFATNRNWVNKISDNRPYLVVGGDAYMSDFVVQQGYEFGDRYTRGWQRDAQGRVIVGANGMPLFTPGRTVKAANFNPDWTSGVSNSLSYKNLSLSFLIEHRQGGTFVSTTDGVLDGEGITERTLNGRDGGLIFGQNLFPNETAVLANGSPNTIALNAQTFWRGVGGRNTPIGEAFVQDATNTRLRELALGYNLPKSMLKKMGIISNVKLSVVGRNLFFFYRTGNWDPEILTSTAPAAEGLQAYVPPTERNFGFNLKIDF